MGPEWKAVALEKCCYCIDLEIGCYIIGYLEVIIGFVAFGLFCFWIHLEGPFIFFGIYYLILILGMIVANCCTGCNLLAGMYKRKREYIHGYLYYWLFNLMYVSYGIYFFYWAVVHSVQIMALVVAVQLVYRLYFLAIVWSYYIRMEVQEGTPLNNLP
ncbi:uncharacterized protein LOC142977046 isoform X2 [Anticarsia gemmatalis]|uniref:uncharacterized protein LOC142977046 isoform X2 n=1 Tax=Anticarsia gemmatalis TaxID=129554 RepID=UPI003F768B02